MIGALVEVANALQGLEHDADGYRAHRRSLDAARASRDLALSQFRAGKVSRLQVLIAEQQFQGAALTQVQADVQRFTDAAALFRALGGGWWNAERDPSSLPTAAAAPILTPWRRRAPRAALRGADMSEVEPGQATPPTPAAAAPSAPAPQRQPRWKNRLPFALLAVMLLAGAGFGIYELPLRPLSRQHR